MHISNIILRAMTNIELGKTKMNGKIVCILGDLNRKQQYLLQNN